MTRQSLQLQEDDGNCEEGEFSSSWHNTLPPWGSGCSKHHPGFCGSVSTTGCALCQTQKSISCFWNPSVALYKENLAGQEALAVLCRQARTQTRYSCGCLRKGEPAAVKIISQQGWGIALYNIYVHVLYIGLRSYRLQLCSSARMSCYSFWRHPKA